MGTQVANFEQGMPALPADLAQYFADHENIKPKATVPSLSYTGKTWSVTINGETKKLMGRNAEGDEVPLQIMRVVILGYNERRGRAYYEGAYDPAKVSLPKCWSTDGFKPDAAVKDKQAPSCDKCPWSVKGSKQTDAGTDTTACAQHRMLALVPSNRLDFEILRLKIAITSDFDGRSPDHEAQGWYSFSKYTEMLRANGCVHSALISTKIKFDPNTAYPKLLFAKDEWLDEDRIRTVFGRLQDDTVKKLLDNTFTPNGADGVEASQLRQQPTQTQARQPDPVVAEDEVIKGTVVEEGEEIVDDGAAFGGETVAAQPTTKATSKPATAANGKAAAGKPAATKAEQKAAPAASTTVVPDNVANL